MIKLNLEKQSRDDFNIEISKNKLLISKFDLDLEIDWSESEINEVIIYKSYQLEFLNGSTKLRKLKINNSDLRYLDYIIGNHNLEELIIEDSDLVSIDGIENFSQLTKLSLCSNQIQDLEPLSNLTNLIELDLSYNFLTDIEPLINLTRLQILDLYENDIEDLSPLEKLNCVRVNLDSNPIDHSIVNFYRVKGKLNYYRPGDSRFPNYKERLKLNLQKIIKIILRKKITLLWFVFFEEKRNLDGFNRFSFLVIK